MDLEKDKLIVKDDGYFNLFLDRTIRMIGIEAVEKLHSKKIAIAGCGGVGGAVSIALARMGISNFTLADPGTLDEPDINRQWGAFIHNLGRNKAAIYEEMLQDINPGITVKKFCEGVTEDNFEEFLSDADLLIDSMDIAVPSSLRLKVYESAHKKQIPAMIAPILGFGAIIAASSGDGMPLTDFGKLLTRVVESSKLPDRLWELFVPEHLVALGRSLLELKAPSVACATIVATSIVCTEATLVLAGNLIPGGRSPIFLPKITVVDLLKMNLQTIHIDELRDNKDYEEKKRTPLATGQRENKVNEKVVARSPLISSRQKQKEILARVGNNTNLLPREAIAVDIMTDSWREIGSDGEIKTGTDESHDFKSPVQLLKELYGYKYIFPVHQGRLAEAILAKAVIKPGDVVATNGLFPTTAYHLTSNGVKLAYCGIKEASNLDNEHPFKGNMDMSVLESKVKKGNVQAVYIELCNNSIGGHPVSMKNLKEIRGITSSTSIPVILDGTRAFENAYLIKEREDGYTNKDPHEILLEICSYSDTCAMSLTKDFKTSIGAFVATNRGDLSVILQDLVFLAFGSGILKNQDMELSNTLMVCQDSEDGVYGRMSLVKRLWKEMEALSIPIIKPVGGHAVYVDAKRFFPHIKAEEFPAQTLANALYIEGGVRGAVNMHNEKQQKEGVQLLRLAFPVGKYNSKDVETVINSFKEILHNPKRFTGLRCIGAPLGKIGDFVAQYGFIS